MTSTAYRPVFGESAKLRVAHDLRRLVAAPPLPTRHFAPLIEQPHCPHCGKEHMASWPCAEKQWNHLQQQQGKTP